MLRSFCLIATLFLFSCKTTSYYIVRHAEKETATMTSDVPLSAEGQQRAEALKELLKNKVQYIYSTNYVRTRSTAQPLADVKKLSIHIYDPRDTGFVAHMKSLNNGNILIVGHSNTVDDLVNKFMNQTIINGDLPETQYGDLFIVKRKGTKYSFEQKHFGK
jgi:2,3-bisphosphoglycerate-dependent phosphoglycerate mutase